MEKQQSSSGICLCTVLFIAFIVLKLTNVIDWSWWWVTAPLWINLLLIIGVFLLIAFIAFVAKILE